MVKHSIPFYLRPWTKLPVILDTETNCNTAHARCNSEAAVMPRLCKSHLLHAPIFILQQLHKNSSLSLGFFAYHTTFFIVQ